MKIYNNPSCSKCAAVLSLLKERKGKDTEPEVINYLETPPTAEELKEIVRQLGITPFDLIRKKEPVFVEKYLGQNLSDDQWIEAMITHPILIERPIIINGNKAVIGRPPSRVLDIL